jgi:hypothetical protein
VYLDSYNVNAFVEQGRVDGGCASYLLTFRVGRELTIGNITLRHEVAMYLSTVDVDDATIVDSICETIGLLICRSRREVELTTEIVGWSLVVGVSTPVKGSGDTILVVIAKWCSS